MKNRLKGFISGVLITTLLFAMTATAFANTINKTISVIYRDIKIYVDGNYIQSKDAKGNTVEAFIYNGTTYLPVRAVSESLGKEVNWDSKTSSVYIGKIPEQMIQEVTVGTAEEFIKAIGSNKKIILKPGVYDLSAIKQVDNSDNTAIWESVYDGQELIVQNVSNLTIEGSQTGITKMITTPRYAQIINFKNSNNITINNITAGHTPMEYACDAGVLLFDGCQNITIGNSEFYGCGSVGLNIDNTENLICDNVNINHCSLRALDIFQSKNITFTNSKIQNHEAYSNIVFAVDSEDITFSGCDITDNKSFEWGFIELWGGTNVIIDQCNITNNKQAANTNWDYYAYFFKVKDISGKSGTVTVQNTKFTGNSCDNLTDNIDAVTFENCTMTNNDWN